MFKSRILNNFSLNSRILRKFNAIKLKVNNLEAEFSKLTNQNLKNKTYEFKSRVSKGESLDNLLPEAFATVREASMRTLNKRHFDVQIIGGIALHNGMVAEMLTGEGKTLVSTLASYLNALEDKGVHIVTVNDYLANRDSKWMGKIFEFLGLTTSCILAGNTDDERKSAYASDITYGTNNEFGFDYLRDNMKLSLKDEVQRPFNFAIVDEVDSVLIDEARTPLIISGPVEDNSKIYKLINELVKKFDIKDFEIDEKQKNVHINNQGTIKLENLLKSSALNIKGSLFDMQNISIYHLFNQSLRAHHIYKSNVDYIVRNGSVILIDEFTGRVMDGRRFSDGLHQALEAKEKVKIQNENQTLASITLQNYFRLYPKLSGMTGTAMTESREFLEIYGLRVLSIPSNRDVIRKDLNDLIYPETNDKYNALTQQIQIYNKQKRPILVGTVSIEKSEDISNRLNKINIPHNVLNAKNHEAEAKIISEAGRLGAVTIATNMAGRGTDIQLGGNLEMIIAEKTSLLPNSENRAELIESTTKSIEAEKIEVIKLGGLVVIGTERHESRRIDNQLRGRSGRQGEPGNSVFYLSLEDDLMRIFGGDKLKGTLKKLGFKSSEPITHAFISKSIEKAQRKVEEYNFQMRKSLLKFDTTINEQRQLIYEQRKNIIKNDIDIDGTIEEYIDDLVLDLVDRYMPEKEFREKWNYELIQSDIVRYFNCALSIKKHSLEYEMDREDIIELIKSKVKELVQLKRTKIGVEAFDHLVCNIMLQNMDNLWQKHLSELEYLRGAINLRAYGQKDPFNEYQKESFDLFSTLLKDIKSDFITILSHLELVDAEDDMHMLADETKENFFSNINRNELCPCGSKKKYKHCHGKI